MSTKKQGILLLLFIIIYYYYLLLFIIYYYYLLSIIENKRLLAASAAFCVHNVLKFKRENPTRPKLTNAEEVYDMIKEHGLGGWSKLTKDEKLAWYSRTTITQKEIADHIVESCQTDNNGDIIIEVDDLMENELI